MYTLYKSKSKIIIDTIIYERGSYFYRKDNSDRIFPVGTTTFLYYDRFKFKLVDTKYMSNRITKKVYKDICIKFNETNFTFFAYNKLEVIPITDLIEITKKQYYDVI